MMQKAVTDPYQPCPCNSGKKFKFCCRGLFDQEDSLALLKRSADYPIYECLVNEGWENKGFATLFVVRQLPNLKYIFGAYLTDTFCLGLKQTFYGANVPYSKPQTLIERTQTVGEVFVDIDYEDARSLIFGSINYAKSFGFAPHVDWKHSQYILEPQRPFENKFEFGRNGEPLYIQGPDDNPMEIMTKLNTALNKSRKKGIFQKLFKKRSQSSDEEWKTPKYIANVPFGDGERISEERPLPANNEEWFEEIVQAFRDAAKTKPFGKFVGMKLAPKDYFQLAPLVFLKFRGLEVSKRIQEGVTESALANYIANQENQPQAMKIPQIAFAVCYLASHAELEIIDGDTLDQVMCYVEANQARMISLTKG